MSQTNQSRYKYTPDEMSEEAFLNRFIVRNEHFEEIFDDLKSTDYAKPQQHYIIVGQRGQGKTTLLRKIEIELRKDKKLSKFLLPVRFTEEQYQVRSLCRLWEEVADYLQTSHNEEFCNVLNEMEEHFDDEDYYLKCFSLLDTVIKSANKKLLLLIDNIDELIGKFSDKEQRQLREILITSSSFRIIGGSTKMLEQHYDNSKPFYQFFKTLTLQGLDEKETKLFLLAIGEGEEKKKIQKLINETPQRIETLRRLTGGVPRTLVMLFDVFMDDGGNTFDDLLRILDEVTPLYKHRMDDLAVQLQDIVHTIAIHWDGITTKEIAKKTRMKSKAVSSQLKQLEKYHIIESESIGKNNIYKIKERFFNIWYLMRFGRKKERQKVEWLVRFLDSWCNHDELEEKAKTLIDAIRDGKVRSSHAFHMTEALSYAGLEMETEQELKMVTKEYLESENSPFSLELSSTDSDLLRKAGALSQKDEFEKAIKLLIVSGKNSGVILGYIAILYTKIDEYDKSEEYFIAAIEKNDILSMFLLASLYEHQKKFIEAEKYYLMAIDNKNINSLCALGSLYANQDKLDKAIIYYKRAIANGNSEAMHLIAFLYIQQDNLKEAEKYYLLAIENNNVDSMLELAFVYTHIGNLSEAEKYYFMAIDHDDPYAISELAYFYFKTTSKIEKAVELAKEGYEKTKNFRATFTLSLLLLSNDEFSKSYELFDDWIEYPDAPDIAEYIESYMLLLAAKGQLYQAKKFLELPEYELKERYKPIWFALMALMEYEFPEEIKKMGSELQSSVSEVLKEIERLKEKYVN